jgi:RimJ/RimL family protein N-acetyltransferase
MSLYVAERLDLLKLFSHANCPLRQQADAASSLPIGMVSLCNHSPLDLRVEIAGLWLTPAFQGTGAMTETVLLVLQHLFQLKYRRVEWRCDGHNVRARRAGHSLGFTFEGVLRKHRVVKDCNCDTVVFALINSEWPVVEDQLKFKVAQAMAKAGTGNTQAAKKTQ